MSAGKEIDVCWLWGVRSTGNLFILLLHCCADHMLRKGTGVLLTK